MFKNMCFHRKISLERWKDWHHSHCSSVRMNDCWVSVFFCFSIYFPLYFFFFHLTVPVSVHFPLPSASRSLCGSPHRGLSSSLHQSRRSFLKPFKHPTLLCFSSCSDSHNQVIPPVIHLYSCQLHAWNHDYLCKQKSLSQILADQKYPANCTIIHQSISVLFVWLLRFHFQLFGCPFNALDFPLLLASPQLLLIRGKQEGAYCEGSAAQCIQVIINRGDLRWKPCEPHIIH